MARRWASLISRHPWRIDIPLALSFSVVLLVLGWTLPLVETRTLIFWHDEYSIINNIRALWEDDKRIAACLVFGASVAYPAFKAVLLLWFLIMPSPPKMRGRLLRLLRLTERWALLDVIVMAVIVLASLTVGPMKSTPKTGLFAFGGSVLMLTITAFLMERTARRG